MRASGTTQGPARVFLARWTSRSRRWTLYALRKRPMMFRLVQRILPKRVRLRPPRTNTVGGWFSLHEYRPVHLPASDGKSLDLHRPDGIGLAERAAIRQAEVVRVPASWLVDEASTRLLLELAAAGAPIEIDGTTPQNSLLDRDLAAAFEPTLNPRERALHSVTVRRAALIAQRRSVAGRVRPKVSVLLSSSRPSELPGALNQIAAQREVEVQLLLGLHGDSWSEDTDQWVRDRWNGELEIARAGSDVPLGRVLETLSAAAAAPLISKWDDDDLYGPQHLADLERAWAYSGAEVVGKFAEFVYLEHSDVTIRRSSTGSEIYGGTIAGGTLLTSQDWLREIGGWPSAPRKVDQLLLNATYAASGTTYRTHSFQFVLRRRQEVGHHTWPVPDTYFLTEAEEIRPGLDRALVDLDDEIPPAASDSTNDD